MTDSTSDRNSADSPPDDQESPFASVLAELRGLRRVFDSKIRYDEAREELVQSLNEELTQHRQNHFRQSMLRPILLDLISLHDDLTQVLDSADTPRATADSLLFFRDGVEQTLARNGVQKYTVDGDAFDRGRQRVVRTVDTGDPALDRTVARRVRAGFDWDGKVLRQEWVSAYRLVTTAPEQPETRVPTQTPENPERPGPSAESGESQEMPSGENSAGAGGVDESDGIADPPGEGAPR